MPLLGTRGAASAQGFGMFGGSKQSYWIGMLGDAGGESGYSVTTDSENNMYIVGVGASNGLIAKYNSSGVIQWQRSLAITGYYSVAIDSANNVYVTGRNGGIQLTKYNSSGVLQFQKKLNVSTGVGNGIAFDSSDNVYIAGKGDDAFGFSEIRIVKYNSGGTLQWQRRLDGSTSSDQQGLGIAVDSSANVYITGYSTASGTIKCQVAKYNSSGTIQWQRETNSSTDQFNGYGVVVDSSANVYVTGDLYVSGIGGLGLVKYDTSGTLQWARRLTGSGQNVSTGISIDSGGNLYISGYAGNSGNNDPEFAKYDSSGTLQWQRRLGTSASDETANSIKTDSVNGFLIGGWTNITGSRNFLFARLPQDGSKTGTYTVGGQSFTYAASGLTGSSPTLTNTTSTLTDAATSNSETTTTDTDAATTFTSSVTTI